jgi:hypothetical protein
MVGMSTAKEIAGNDVKESPKEKNTLDKNIVNPDIANKKIKKPGVYKIMSIGLSLSIMSMLIFILIYQGFVDMTPKKVIGQVADSTYNHASKDSVFYFFNSLTAKCTQMNDMMSSLGVLNPTVAQLKDSLSKSGLDQKEQNSLIKFYEICGLKDDDNKVFFDRLIDYGMTLFIGKEAVESKSAFTIFLTKNMGKVPDSNMAGVANNLSTALWLVDVVFSVRNVIIGIIFFIGLLIFLSYGHLAYLFDRFSKSLIGLGLSFIVPFLLVSYILMSYPIDTSFGFQAMTTMFSGSQFNAALYGESLMITIALMTLEIFYPLSLAIAGFVILILGIGSQILVKNLIKKGKLGPLE